MEMTSTPKQMKLFQGQSEITCKKELDFYGIIKTRLNQRKFQSYIKNVYVADLFCGEGENIINGEIIAGSPIKSAQAIESSGIHDCKNIFLLCSDARFEAVDILNNHFDQTKYSFEHSIFKRDAFNQLSYIHKLALKERDSHFIIIIDPNGPKGIPFTEIMALSTDYRVNNRIDIVINVSITSLKRMIAHRKSAGAEYGWWISSVDSIGRDFILKLAGKYKAAWIRENLGDKLQWMIISFFNWSPPRNDWRKAGFFSLKSRSGKKALESYKGVI